MSIESLGLVNGVEETLNSHPHYLFVRNAFSSSMVYCVESHDDKVLDSVAVSFDFDRRSYRIWEEKDLLGANGEILIVVKSLLTDDELFDLTISSLESLINLGLINNV